MSSGPFTSKMWTFISSGRFVRTYRTPPGYGPGADSNLGLEIPDDHCTTVHQTQTDQRINFTLTCKEVSNTLTITCDTSIGIAELSFNGKTNGTLHDYYCNLHSYS